MNTKDFHQLLSCSFFMGKERAEAWRIYKEKSPEEALIFVEDIKARMALLRQNAVLREIPVPYKI